MQLTTILLAAVALTGVAGDRVMTTTACKKIGGGCSRTGEWQTSDGKKHYFNVKDGCYNPKIPPAKWVCWDLKNKRAHWDPKNGGPKRCYKKMRADFDVGDCADSSLKCSRQWWDPHACNW